MFFQLRTRWAKRRFNAQISEVLNTQPIRLEPADFTILSMVSHDDLLMYLLAIKSFYAQLQHGKILVIDDGSLTREDKEILKQHLRSPTIVHREVIDVGRLLRHIMWERLAYAVDLSTEEYVIQLDSDTITQGPIPEMIDCIAANRAFVMGTWEGLKTVPVSVAAAYAKGLNHPHIQLLTERALARLPNSATLKYVRGSAGLFGLAHGGFGLAETEDFYLKMVDLVGERFREWGTDQVAVNFLVSNSPDPLVLPYPDYAIFGPRADVEKARFLHFIGTHRFRDGIYARQGRRFIMSETAGHRLDPAAAGCEF